MRRVAIVLGVLVATCGCGFALNPSLDISQYGHHAWTVPDGFSLGNIYAMAQTPDGYLSQRRVFIQAADDLPAQCPQIVHVLLNGFR